MRRLVGASEESESGVVLVIFAITIVILLGMISIAIDGSYGFVQNRRAQNASDFAAFAAAQQLENSSYCDGTGVPTTQQITAVIQQLVSANGSGIGTNWKAEFLNSAGNSIGTFSPSNDAANPPPGACGVAVTARPAWTPFFAGIFGIHQFKGFASASVGTTQKGSPIGIVALNKVGPHEILGGGTGTFLVEGNIFSNTDVSLQPWTQSAYGDEWDDAIDAKTDSNLYVYGTIDTYNGTYNNEPLWPLDHCFIDAGLLTGSATSGPSAPGGVLPNERPACSVGTVTVDYNSIDNVDYGQIDDPLQASDAPASPLASSTNIACPGRAPVVNPPTQVVGGVTELLPGEYTTPVELTGATDFKFEDCSGYGAGEAAYPGIYRFDDGLWINPTSGHTVTGNNIVISTKSPYPLAGNVPGTVSGGKFAATGGGNGAPCLPSGTMTSAASGGGSPESEISSTACAGTNSSLYGAVAYGDTTYVPDPNLVGTGDNFSLMIGGASGATVNLTGPTTGPYAGTDGSPGVVLYQDSNPQDPNSQANYGFDAQSGDAAAITITGVVYNASLAGYGDSSPTDYWDGVSGGIPFYAGGTLQTGFGAGWTSSDGPAPSNGSVTINGTAIVDDFNTDGTTGITIVGQPYKLPGGSELSLIG
ncbi:MAG: Tad domain-containing protein [Acidimicrobiales bacterium]|jgi:hypothetical protein